MEIGIDFRPALTSGAGIGRYARGLVSGFDALGADAADVRVRLYACLVKRVAHRVPTFANERISVEDRAVSARLINWLGRIGYGSETHFGDVDLFHFTDFAALPFRRTPHVFTLHDVGFLVDERWHERRATVALRRILARLVDSSRLVLVHSAHTANELRDRLGLAPDRVRVVAPGVETRFAEGASDATIAAVRARYRLPERYVLAVGTLEPRKNIPRLVAAFERVAAHDRTLGLVLVGGRGWLDRPILERIEASPMRDRIVRVGRVDDAALPAVYAGAHAAAYVSLYEGFGLPALEALASGVPTVASSTTSLPEVVGDAALTADPEDDAAIEHALDRVCRDASLRARLAVDGPARAATFTWRRTAERTLDAYRAALTNGGTA